MNLKQIKLAVVKYIDKVILLVLIVVFISALLRVLVKDDPELVKLKNEISSAKTRVEQKIDQSEPPPVPQLAYAEDLRERFAHIPVVEPYRPYVLYPPVPIFWGVFRPIVGEETTLEMPEIKLIRVSQWDPEIIKILGIEPLDPDDDLAGRKVRIMPLKATANTPTPITKLEVEDDAENRYVAHIIVYEKVLPDQPLPPKDVEIQIIRGQVLISAYMDNPSPLPPKTTETVGFRIYRKLAGRPDSEYKPLVDEKRPVVPDERQRDFIRRRLRLGPYSQEQIGPGAVSPDGVIDAPQVEEVRDTRRQRMELVSQQERERYLVWFLDDTVRAGREYVYKIVSVSVAFGEERKRTESDPWISDVIPVPSVVEVRLRGSAGGAATFGVWKLDYDRDDWDSASFRVTAGMKIGETRRVRRDEQTLEGVKRVYVDVNFDTGCYLVEAVDEYTVYQIQMEWPPNLRAAPGRAIRRVPNLIKKTVPAAIVQERDGSLRVYFREGTPERVLAKEKEKEAALAPIEQRP